MTDSFWDLDVSSYVRTYVQVVCPFPMKLGNEIRHVSRGPLMMHDGVPCDPIQGQGQETLNVLYAPFTVRGGMWLVIIWHITKIWSG